MAQKVYTWAALQRRLYSAEDNAFWLTAFKYAKVVAESAGAKTL